MLHSRWRVVDKLGFGGYSTTWLARDELHKRYVAVKVGISDTTSRHNREPEILRAIQRSSSSSHKPSAPPRLDAATLLPTILDAFDIRGPNGTHPCYALPLAQGNLREASFSRLFPIQVARALSANLVTAVAVIHSLGIVHGVKMPSTFDELSVQDFRDKYGEPEKVPISRVDGKPLTANVPKYAVEPLYLGKKAQDFTLADAQGLILSDFGEAFCPGTERRLGRECNAPLAKKAPEAVFELDAPLTFSSDIWSLGTAIWEILGMKFIFSEAETQDEISAQQIDVLGATTFPESWREQWERQGDEDSHGARAIPRRPTGERETWPRLENAFEEFVQKYRRKREATGIFDEQETRAILELIRGMLRFRPEERLTADEVLMSEWMVKWALPELELD
ncbi:protein kinase [Diaporthe helianthi]|uniref:Protein kinase n=1 Tax=Diaporthe helianthi TaxID=158607 RepID=A0A2P5HTG1_DIAHE|nr:protein kinase [Diaporthe helianthi]